MNLADREQLYCGIALGKNYSLLLVQVSFIVSCSSQAFDCSKNCIFPRNVGWTILQSAKLLKTYLHPVWECRVYTASLKSVHFNKWVRNVLNYIRETKFLNIFFAPQKENDSESTDSTHISLFGYVNAIKPWGCTLHYASHIIEYYVLRMYVKMSTRLNN